LEGLDDLGRCFGGKNRTCAGLVLKGIIEGESKRGSEEIVSKQNSFHRKTQPRQTEKEDYVTLAGSAQRMEGREPWTTSLAVTHFRRQIEVDTLSVLPPSGEDTGSGKNLGGRESGRQPAKL